MEWTSTTSSAASLDICRQDSARSESGRPSGRAADEIRASDQSQDSKVTRSRHAGQAARPRRRGDRMSSRREFITLLGGAAAWPLAADAQQQAMPVIGFLNSGTREGFAHLLAAFHQSLNQAGFVEGRNVAIEYRWAEGHYDQLTALAADLVRRQVTVIAATTTPAALAAKTATSAIPIIFTAAADPVTAGLVTSLNRPGGNATGVSNYLTDLGAKRLDLLRELVPKATTIGMLVNPNYPDIESQQKDVEEAARRYGQRVHVVNAASVDDFDKVLAILVQLNASALLISPDALFQPPRSPRGT